MIPATRNVNITDPMTTHSTAPQLTPLPTDHPCHDAPDSNHDKPQVCQSAPVPEHTTLPEASLPQPNQPESHAAPSPHSCLKVALPTFATAGAVPAHHDSEVRGQRWELNRYLPQF